MTAYADKELAIKALRCRCDGFIEKPLTPDILFAEINRVNRAVLQKASNKVNENLQDISSLLELPSQSRVDELARSLQNSQGHLPPMQEKENVMCYRQQQVVQISQDHLAPTQKMEIVNTRADRIGHDLNKLFQTIQGQIGLLLLQKTKGNPEYGELKRLEEATRRGAKLVEQLRSL
jgi:response regulator RpfG family c-di-GMP phosphodiesterase